MAPSAEAEMAAACGFAAEADWRAARAAASIRSSWPASTCRSRRRTPVWPARWVRRTERRFACRRLSSQLSHASPTDHAFDRMPALAFARNAAVADDDADDEAAGVPGRGVPEAPPTLSDALEVVAAKETPGLVARPAAEDDADDADDEETASATGDPATWARLAAVTRPPSRRKRRRSR